MNTLQPIFTEKAQCQDCYRCVRNCPVKAIKIEQGVASVVEELCIHCGKCVNSCPSGAKRVRNDRDYVRSLIHDGEKVIVSIAPSYVSEFQGIDPLVLLHAIKQIGFFGVSETALGAQEVSAHAAQLLAQENKSVFISTACPTVVKLIQKYYPSLSKFLTPFLSPLLTHCRILKESFPDSRIVFFGPCIAKKSEASEHPELLDAVLTFDDLRILFGEEGIDISNLPPSTESFIPDIAQEGTLYPVDGGMIAGIRNNCRVTERCAMNFSGIEEICSVIRSLEHIELTQSLFLELLACPGGCVNGPGTSGADGLLFKRIAVLNAASLPNHEITRKPSIDIVTAFQSEAFQNSGFSPESIETVLKSIGKNSKKEELNCGGCGYDNCRDFSGAVLSGKAETVMCVTFMRQLAQKKANKLIEAMPAGVVIVGNDLRIIECNEGFAKLGEDDALSIYHQVPGMRGAVLEKVFPVSNLFQHVLETGEEITGKDLQIKSRIMHCSVFTIEPGSIAGGIFSDITAPELKKEEIITRAETVIRNNLSTVQKIAYLLGENASETEMVLSTIIDSFKAHENKI